MDTRDIRTLRIIEEVERNNQISQRDIAKKLNISLGLVNSFVKRLINKGYLKITSLPKSRIKYILTPTGIVEKTRLSCDYIQYSFQFYRKVRRKFKALFIDLKEKNIDTVAFFGVNELAEISFICLQETDIHLVAVFDKSKMGQSFMNRRILSPSQIHDVSYDKLLVFKNMNPFVNNLDNSKIISLIEGITD